MASYSPFQSSPYTRWKALITMNRFSSPKPVSMKPMTAPERKAHMKAGAMPLRASTAVRALAYVAIFMPTKPDRIEVAAPTRNAMVEKVPLRTSSACVRPSSGVTIDSRPKMAADMMTMKTDMYLYSVVRKEEAPSEMAFWMSAAFWMTSSSVRDSSSSRYSRPVLALR